MEAVVLVIHLIVALAIIAVVLIQPSEAGGFLGSSGSMSNLMAPRRTVDGLTRLTTILAGCFFLTSLTLAIIAEHRPAEKSILDVPVEKTSMEQKAPAAVPPAPAPAVKAEEPKSKPAAPISK